MTTIGELHAEVKAATGDRRIARWLCEVAVGLDGDEFLAASDEPVTTTMMAHLDAMLERWRAGEPIAYVLGRWGFRHLDVAVDHRVLIPRPETEMVADVAIDLARRRHEETGTVVIVDLGTGSGVIGLSMARELPRPGTTVWLTDVDSDALEVARANLAGIGRDGTGVRIAEGSWFEALGDDVVADVVVANPPYIADGDPEVDDAVRRFEPAGALYAGADGLDAIRAIASGAPRHLAPGGWLVLEIGATQGAAVAVILTAAGLTEVEIRPDLTGRDRIALGRAPIVSGSERATRRTP